MKIAGIIFESLLKAGGYEVFTFNLHMALAARGHDVTLYLPRAEVLKRRAFYADLPFAVRPMILQTNFFLKNAPALLQCHLSREQTRHLYDVWQVMGAWPEGFAVQRVRGPKVMRNYGEDIQLAPELGYGARQDPSRDRIIRGVLRSMDRVVAMTASLAELQRKLGVPDSRIVRIPNGISLERFRRPVDREAARKRLGLPLDAPVILTVGRNHPKKGFDLIPGIAAKLRAAGHDFRWLVLGGGTDSLLPEARRLGLDDVVLPRPPIQGTGRPSSAADMELPPAALLEVYGLSDLFVLPSRLEGFSRVILEAMAAGLPVVTTDAPGCGEVLRHGVQGLISPVDDMADMAHNISTLLNNAGVLSSYAEQARVHASAFDWDCIAAAYEAVYLELMENGCAAI